MLGSSLSTVEWPSIEAASSAVVVLGLETTQIGIPFDGFGIVYPHCLNRDVIALSFSSNKFPGRAPVGRVLVRAFIGGALRPELVDLPDDDLKKIVTTIQNGSTARHGLSTVDQ